MAKYHIGSVNAHNAQIGDHNTQHNTQVTIDDELARLDAAIDRHAALLTDVAAAHNALDALRVSCAARPVDRQRAIAAAGELAAATAGVPVINAGIVRLLGHISP